jgi:stage III sporulation protein AG
MGVNGLEKWWRFLEGKFGGDPGGPSRITAVRWIFIAAAAGVAIMLIASFMTVKELEPNSDAAPSGNMGSGADQPVFKAGGEREARFIDYESSYESEIKDILAKIVGVGAVDVLVTVDSTEEIVVEHNYTESQQTTNETDPQGAKRHISSTSKSGDVAMSKDAPIIGKTLRPKIRGVVVVAEGAENMTVKKMIQEAVSKGLDVPAHRISIVPSKR